MSHPLSSAQRRTYHEKKESKRTNSFASLSTLESKVIARDLNNYAATPPPLPVTPPVAMVTSSIRFFAREGALSFPELIHWNESRNRF
ncbi:hypothetical protein TNCT_685481 [Trichonephila clavata]|uniref:Uncharacterized protein n=1 Tax=Trichonephila clavata TaxID=2740835 RepID=A0A8X6FDW0_TRICU|nr:hypothetical protein TNCT_685481 [Trichonephila clavata]